MKITLISYFRYLTFPVLLVMLGITTFLLSGYFPWLENFIRSEIFNPLVTLLAGSVVYVLYRKQNDDFKKDAASIILLEIENAESLLKKAYASLKIGTNQDEARFLPESNFVMKKESWSRFRHLFVRDLTRVEWEAISEFYDKCMLFDKSIEYNDSFFQKDVEQIRKNAHRIIAELVKVAVIRNETEEKKKDVEDEMRRLKSNFESMYLDEKNIFLYSPKKPMLDTMSYLSNMNLNLTLTTVGIKLRAISEAN